MPALFHHIQIVVASRAEKQMLWIDAISLIASVTNVKTFWNWSHIFFV